MGLPRFTFYDAPAIPADDDVIVARITVICDDFEAYGYRQVGAELRHQGVVVNSKKLRRLMRENDLQPKGDAYRAITSVISWERFCATVAEAKALARPEGFDAYQSLGEHYAGVRRWSPAFLEAFVFESVPACASLMRAIAVLRAANRSNAANLPKTAPTGFVRRR